MDKTAKHSSPPCSLCCAGAATSMKMHHFHDRQCTLITWEVVVKDDNKEELPINAMNLSEPMHGS